MTTGQPASGFRYWAFISYSHTDASWGRWLHKALETYRVPRRLVGMPIAAGSVPARLTPVFRDRDELPTASDLGAAVEEALSQSWCLIVICSPESARSRWVNEEVLAFQRLGRGDRIHCLVVDGGPDPAAPLCFPPSLEQAQSRTANSKSEPVAADARRFADGRSHALLKLIAGILGIGYDTLVQRDQQRRHRSMFRVTCASLALVVVLGLSTLIAITSRREAVDQRSHAEGLVEFMIGDLRKKLEPDGKLATLDAVGKEALAYYAAQKSEDLDAEGLARRARALHMIGEVYDLRGELDEALKVFEQAADSTAELVVREPNNGQLIFDHAQSVFWVGYIAYQRGNIAVAEPAFQEYKRLAERLIAIDPANDDWQAEVGYANSNLGTLLYEQGRLRDAAAIFSQELEMAKQATNRLPDSGAASMRTAQAHAWLSDVLRDQGQFSAAASNRQEEIEIYLRSLGKDAKNQEAREALLVSRSKLAGIELDLGQISPAVAQLQQSLALAIELTTADPDNARWAEIASGAYARLANALVHAGELAAAGKVAAQGIEVSRNLLRRDASVISWQFGLIANLLAQARVVAATGEELSALQQAREIVRILDALPSTQLREGDRDRAMVQAYMLMAEIQQQQGSSTEANRTWQQVVELLDTEHAPSDPGSKASLAIALYALGRRDEASRLASWLSSIDYQEPGYTSDLQHYLSGPG
ncbi:TIR domain-containing protein [Dokdonella sp.]|uniref:TIR domain-containing protein n=1 Tax=Dokdonella sp. TaxID=2291710 RepID=UPI00352825C0